MTKRTIILLGFILTKFLLQYLLFNPSYDLHRDEYLHLDQANHLAWGYFSVPPVTSWISYLIKVLGNSVFWIKFFPALFGTLTLLLVWKSIEALKGNLYALLLGATCILFSSLLRINFLYQPNSLDILCWTAFYFILIKYFSTNNRKWLYWLAVMFAIGFLNKYNIAFLIIGLVPALLFSKQNVVFRRTSLYYSVLLSFICISPNLYWQYMNGFPVFRHLKELSETQLVHVERLAFLKEQVFYFMGALPVIAAALYGLLMYAPFKKYQFFFWSFILTLATYIFLKAKGYYAIGIYPIYISFGAVYLGNSLRRRWKKHLRIIFILSPLLFYALFYKTFYTIENPARIIENRARYRELGLLHWEDGKNHNMPQDFADMLGWKELAVMVDGAYAKLPTNSRTIVLCDNYGQAGAINYYTSNKRIEAVAFSADYANWFSLEQPIENVIRVKEYVGSQNELNETGPYFKKSHIAGSVSNQLAREYRTTIFVFTGAKVDVNARLKAEVRTAAQ